MQYTRRIQSIHVIHVMYLTTVYIYCVTRITSPEVTYDLCLFDFYVFVKIKIHKIYGKVYEIMQVLVTISGGYAITFLHSGT